MLNVPAEIQAVIKNDATLKNFRVHFPNGEMADLTNENIAFESVNFNESVCSNNVLKFGLSEASVIEFEAVGVGNIFGTEIECSMEFKVPENLQETYGEWYSIPYGTFIVEKCQRDQRDVTHRRITAYSKIKYLVSESSFLQQRVLPVSSVFVPFSSMQSYLTGDTSNLWKRYERDVSASDVTSSYMRSLFDASGNRYNFSVSSGARGATGTSGGNGEWASCRGYTLDFKETGTKTNEEVGAEIVDWVNNLGLDLRYDSKKKQIFETNEEAIKFVYLYFFQPSEESEDSISEASRDTTIVYRKQPAGINRFTPVYFENVPKIGLMCHARKILCLLGSDSSFTITLNKYQDSAVTNSYTKQITGYKATAHIKEFHAKTYPAKNELGLLKINSTLVVSNSFLYKKTSAETYYYGKMYAYSNAFSVRELANGNAELNAGFIHSERDGTTSIDRLNIQNIYQLNLDDIEGSAWWNEYDVVSSIGAIKYTFTNPATGQIASGSYVFNPEAKSIYDLSGNKFLEKMDFSVEKTKKWLNENQNTDCKWYLYNGTDATHKNHVYTYFGGSWEECGLYKDATSLVEFVLNRLFVPYVNTANFTPVEMNIRGLPFLEAGDAFKFTAKDGTQVQSFILNHSIDGIQHLSESIDSVTGEVIS